jgi:small Trp-rich protein
MYFLGLGLVLLALKLSEFGWVANWSWWVIATPFALAVAWWTWADHTGYTKKKMMERENRRAQARKERTREALGQINRGRRR